MPDFFNYTVEFLETNADDKTPVALYANLRQMFPETLLLECVEPHSPQDARSYLCADPIARFLIRDGTAVIEQLGRKLSETELQNPAETVAAFNDFKNRINIESANNLNDLLGLFGYVGYNAIPFFEDIEFPRKPAAGEQIPAMQFALYRYVFRFDHFHHTLTAIKLGDEQKSAISLEDLLVKISTSRAADFPFASRSAENSNLSDQEFAEKVELCQQHIQRGDVFQIVPSRKFAQNYSGDEFAVYRALRRINPSPYLFFYDFGSFALFGSSPEAQLVVKNNSATLNPIAGTYPRGDDSAHDSRLAAELANDQKENAEHTMLVDLARNDLGRHCQKITVEKFKETEFFSHVIHLVSRVSGELKSETNAFEILADTFPAGTLSGAPKYSAMQILNRIEPQARSFYGGSVGFFGLGGGCTLAIIIRSFLAKNRQLIFQAGAGIVSDSNPETETAEVRNKLQALRRAIETAESLNHK